MLVHSSHVNNRGKICYPLFESLYFVRRVPVDRSFTVRSQRFDTDRLNSEVDV